MGALLALLPAASRANPLDAFGFTARGQGMASAVTATTRDVAATYYNPAGLAASDALTFELGWTFAQPRLSLGAGDMDVDAHRGFQGGFALAGQVLDRRVGFSIGLSLPDRQITRVRALPQRQPRFVLYDNRPQRIVLSAALALELWEDLYLGAALTFLSNAVGRLEIEGRLDVSEQDTALISNVYEDLTAKRYPTVGVQWRGHEHLRLGASFREQFELKLAVEVHVAGDIFISDLNPDEALFEGAFFDTGTLNHNHFSPRQLTLGAAWEEERWLVEVDVSWLDFSRFPSPTAEVDFDLDIPGASFDIPETEAIDPPRFHDILVPRLGAELEVARGESATLRLRAGTFFEPSPAPDQPGRTNYADPPKIGASLGLGLAWDAAPSVLPRPIELDLSALLVALPEREYRKDDPADPAGSYVASGLVWGLTAGFKTRF